MLNRHYSSEVLPEIMNHWSPRAFDPARPVGEADLQALLEAAGTAPSSMNEQPWQFLLAESPAARGKLIAALSTGNQAWAFRAPVLMLVLGRKTYAANGRDNRWHQFDTGTAWGYLQLEAQRRGLVTHAMGGVDAEKARESFALSEDLTVIAALAIGYYGDPLELSPKDQEREHPQPRRPVGDYLVRF